jgi:hypothetical protein
MEHSKESIIHPLLAQLGTGKQPIQKRPQTTTQQTTFALRKGKPLAVAGRSGIWLLVELSRCHTLQPQISDHQPSDFF